MSVLKLPGLLLIWAREVKETLLSTESLHFLSHLITKGVSADGDGLRPAWNKPGNVLADDWLAEDGAAQDVPDGAVGALPHLFQAKL